MWVSRRSSFTENASATSVRGRDYRQPGARRICLFGQFGQDNYGNDGSLEAMLLFLRETWPDTTLSCVCTDPDRVNRDYNIPSVPIKWDGISTPALRLLNKLSLGLPHKLGNWLAAIRHMRKFDVLLLPGTGPLCDFYAGPFGRPYAVFRWTAAARLAGARVFFVSVGASPVFRRLSRWMLVNATRLATYRSFRDTNAKEYLGSVGVDTRQDQVYPDLAFKLPVPDLRRNGPLDSNPVTIVVGVMNYNGWDGHTRSDTTIYDTYIAKMTGVVRKLLDRGFRVRVLGGDNSDRHAVARLRDAVVADLCTEPGQPGSQPALDRLIVEPVNCLWDVMCQMSEASVVIASRFHNVVCALKLARPTISLGYQDKHDAVMQTFDLGEFCQNIERFDPDLVLRQVEEQLSDYAVYEQKMQQKLPRLKAGIAEQERVLVQLL